MRRRIGILIAVVVALGIICCGGGLTVFFLGDLPGKDLAANPASLRCGDHDTVTVNGKLPSVRSLTDSQTRNAAVIIHVGQQLKVPPRGWVIAIATALQEANLNNLGNLGRRNDHDSLGLFQQRPSQGWGTVAQVMDPAYAARKFYQKLVTVSGWQHMSLTDAAQDVQHSAFPNAYAKHEPLATSIVNALADGAARSVGSLVSARCTQPGEIAASGWTVPLRGAINSGFRPPNRPTHNGVDLQASKHTKIVAASAGVVTVVRCQASTPGGGYYSCDRDGSLNIQGCGWYVEILHAGNIITRYCHQLQRPIVTVGQEVTAGQQIGWSGDSGNSSGPHLHFEVHINGDNSAAGAINPVPFMSQQGASLGASA
jgi:murein DD-endopeptidase MepM/ murein hydrolase activator NlpD